MLILIAAVLTAALAAGCGSSGSSSSTESSSTTSSGGSTAEFIEPGGENTLPKFGQEADDAEREAASDVLEENLQARASGDWATQCSSLTATIVKNLEGTAQSLGGEANCVKGLEAQAQPVSATKAIRANPMTGPVAVLRVEGSKAYALFHGTKGDDFAMSMTKEGGQWKVNSLVTIKIS